MSDAVSTAQLWLRACSLVVADMSGNGVELAGPTLDQVLRIRFTVQYQTMQTPANLHARVYNLSPNTIQQIVGYAAKNAPTATALHAPTSAQVILKAGYQANFATLFRGQIYQLRVGKETNVDSYLDIFAADGDLAYNWATLNKSLAAGYTSEDIWHHAGASMSPWQIGTGTPPSGLSTNPSPRGRVLFGMTRDVLRDEARYNNYTWAILDGQLQGLPRFGVRAGAAIVINSQTGQVGVPEQTENGVSVTCLLNPALRWGSKIQLNNTEIARFIEQSPGLNAATAVSPSISGQAGFIPPLNSDGIYTCLYVEHVGDTRGTEWFSKVIALSVDPSATLPQAKPDVQLPAPLPQYNDSN